MNQTVTRVTVEDAVAQKETMVEVKELGCGELVARFKPYQGYLRGFSGDATVVLYITSGAIVLHIESKKGEEYRDDCLHIDGSDIDISEITKKSSPCAQIKNWRDPKSRALKPASHSERKGVSR